MLSIKHVCLVFVVACVLKSLGFSRRVLERILASILTLKEVQGDAMCFAFSNKTVEKGTNKEPMNDVITATYIRYIVDILKFYIH